MQRDMHGMLKRGRKRRPLQLIEHPSTSFSAHPNLVAVCSRLCTSKTGGGRAMVQYTDLSKSQRQRTSRRDARCVSGAEVFARAFLVKLMSKRVKHSLTCSGPHRVTKNARAFGIQLTHLQVVLLEIPSPSRAETNESCSHPYLLIKKSGYKTIE
eukprot:1149862-Pelagomonas_calceolata.AAC.6